MRARVLARAPLAHHARAQRCRWRDSPTTHAHGTHTPQPHPIHPPTHPPTQVLFKSAKVIPVMLMGKVINKAQYSVSDYAEAIVITCGVATFSLSKSSAGAADQTETKVS